MALLCKLVEMLRALEEARSSIPQSAVQCCSPPVPKSTPDMDSCMCAPKTLPAMTPEHLDDGAAWNGSGPETSDMEATVGLGIVAGLHDKISELEQHNVVACAQRRQSWKIR